MSSIYIDFGYDDNVKRSLNSAKRAISSRISDYQGIQRELSNTTSHTNNLSTANTYIQRKINTLQDKYNRLDRFAGKIKDFNDNATEIDRRVADRINTETNQFYKRENIPHGFLYTIGSAFCEGIVWLGGKIKEGIDNFVEGCKVVWETVKQWYEDNKYWIDIVVDVFCVVAAVVALAASGGAVAAVFAVWGLAKATADLCYDVAAYGAYKDGDMELYEELSEKGLKDVMKQEMGAFGEYLYYGMEIASAIYSIGKMGKSFVQVFKVNNTHQALALKNATLSTVGLKTMKQLGSDGALKVLTSLDKLNVFTSNTKWVVKGFQNFMKYSGGTATLKTISITYNVDKILTSGQSVIDLTKPIVIPQISSMQINVAVA